MSENHDREAGARPCVVLGVSGSIAAYKAADLTSRLVQGGMDVHVVMTESATRLVDPRTFLTLSRNPVVTSLWDVPQWQPGHIALADLADLLVLVPATANVLGKLANGIADDALSTLALSFDGPVLAAPAMNPRMWSHPAVQRNVKVLTERGVGFVWPGTGPVACGDIGTGRLADVSLICQRVHESLAPACGGGRRAAAHSRRVLVTAGPTREAIDPVRFLSNRSSGRMGLAVAEAALAGGHEVTVIAGPISLPAPPGCRWIPVQTAAEMADAVKREFPQCDVLVMAAAVADYRPVRVLDQKLSKTEGPLALTLERTEDILTSVSRLRREGQVVVGFAAETAELEDRARAKLDTKRLDFVVANDVGRSDIGFGSEENEVTVLWAGGSCRLPRQSKRDLATAILDLVLNKE